MSTAAIPPAPPAPFMRRKIADVKQTLVVRLHGFIMSTHLNFKIRDEVIVLGISFEFTDRFLSLSCKTTMLSHLTGTSAKMTD